MALFWKIEESAGGYYFVHPETFPYENRKAADERVAKFQNARVQLYETGTRNGPVRVLDEEN